MTTQQEQQEQQMTENKTRIMTGFIHYDENDDKDKLFNILKEYRTNYGLKFSHQSKAQMVFFNISSEYMSSFSKVRPFKISHFQTRTEYKCDDVTSSQLMKQKDSFLRMMWNQETGSLTFLSRTPARVHSNLVRRVFRDSGVQFHSDSYSFIKNSSKTDGETEEEGEVVETEGRRERREETTKDSTPDGFQRVERKTRKPKNTRSNSSTVPTTVLGSTASKVVKVSESKPKVRGSKTPMADRA